VKYLCFGYYDKDKFDGMTENERNAMFDTCLEYDDHLRASGHWAGGEALQGPETALTLYWKNDKVATTDGPFAETKELIAGYWIWKVKSMDEAVEWVKRSPNPHQSDSEIEIRPLYEMEDFGPEFTPELREQEERLRRQIADEK